MRTLCSCGREEVELGCELCRICHSEYEERQYYRALEEEYYADQEAEYNAWLEKQKELEDGTN